MMYEIFIILIALAMMARRGRGRKRAMGRYIRGSVNEQLALTTLASKTVVLVAFDDAVNERTLISSIVAKYTLSVFTPGSGVGPIMVGVAHSDYSVDEIDEWIENTGSWDEGALIEQEQGKRFIRQVGVFDTPDDANDSSELNDGKAIKTKLNWILNQQQTLSLWAYNLGNNAVATTTPIVTADGHANLFPK